MKVLFFRGFILVLLFVMSCSRQDPMQPATNSNETSTAVSDANRDLAAIGRDYVEMPNTVMGTRSLVVVPAGSQDALADAIAEAGPGGTVLLKSGQHDESARIEITQTVQLLGEPGAVLVMDSQSSATNLLDPALYVHGASKVVIFGLEIRPNASEGGVAIMLEDAPKAVVAKNKIYDHQHGVLLQNSDKSIISNNVIAGAPSWQTGALAFVSGIVVFNGDYVILEKNEVTSCVFGLFASNYKGLMVKNKAYGNQFGMILCKVQPISTDPAGNVIGSVNPATQWKMMYNESSNNFYAGYLVIDGANHNYIANNSGSGNAVYDIELTGDTSKFGVFTPKSYENIAITGSLLTKDCGENNKVVSSNLVDNTVEPCL